MKGYALMLVIISLSVFTLTKCKRSFPPYYTPLLQEVLTPVEYKSIYPSGKRARATKQLKEAKRRLEAMLSRTTDSSKRKGIERELAEIGHIIIDREF